MASIEYYGTGRRKTSTARVFLRPGKGAITVTGTPERGAVVARAKELLHFARTQGYQPDELITIIQQLE